MLRSKEELERIVTSRNKEETNNLAIDLNEVFQELFEIADDMLKTLQEFKSENTEIFREKLNKVKNNYNEIVK